MTFLTSFANVKKQVKKSANNEGDLYTSLLYFISWRIIHNWAAEKEEKDALVLKTFIKIRENLGVTNAFAEKEKEKSRKKGDK